MMFSNEYFKYLSKSKKYLLIFIFVITLLNIFGADSTTDSLYIQCFLSLILSYLIPVNVFYHIHDKRAVDTYFSIPVSRTRLLLTGLLFSFAVCYIPFAITAVVYGISKALFTRMLLLLIGGSVSILCLVLFNTLIYLIANNAIDGVIMLGAYSFLPLMLYITADSFVSSYVAGGRGAFDFDFLKYTSFVYLSGDLLSAIMNRTVLDIPDLAVLIIGAAVSAYLLKKEYVDRSVERAGTVSDGLFSYPLIIYLYVFLCLSILASFYDYSYASILSYIRNDFVVYVLLFAVYIFANFIYRRKINISYRLPVFFAVAVIISLLSALLFRGSRGFGLAEKYIVRNTDTYMLNAWEYDDKNELYAMVKEKTGVNRLDYLYVTVNAGDDRFRHELRPETLEILEKYRKEGIEYFYDADKKYIQNNGYIEVISKDDGRTRRYSYMFVSRPDLDVLVKLAEDPAVEIYISTDDNAYRLTENGELKQYSYY